MIRHSIADKVPQINYIHLASFRQRFERGLLLEPELFTDLESSHGLQTEHVVRGIRLVQAVREAPVSWETCSHLPRDPSAVPWDPS